VNADRNLGSESPDSLLFAPAFPNGLTRNTVQNTVTYAKRDPLREGRIRGHTSRKRAVLNDPVDVRKAQRTIVLHALNDANDDQEDEVRPNLP
jgi:hypothetical protein